MFGKEEKEIVAYKSRMDRVLDISMKEALIQVFECCGGGEGLLIFTKMRQG